MVFQVIFIVSILPILPVLPVMASQVEEAEQKTTSLPIGTAIVVGLVFAVVASGAYFYHKSNTLQQEQTEDLETAINVEPATLSQSVSIQSVEDAPKVTRVPEPKGKVGKMVDILEERASKEPMVSMLQREKSFDPYRAASPKRF